MVKIGNKKTIKGSLWGDWKRYQKMGGKFYPVMFTDTAYMPDLNVNISSVTCVLNILFKVTSEK